MRDRTWRPWRSRFAAARPACAAPNGPASRADIALDDETIKAFWAIRKSAEPLVYGKHEHLHPVGFIEDTSMDPRRLGEYLEGKERIFAKHGIEYATYGHAGAGVLHTRPYLDLTIPEHCEKMEQIAVETYELLLRLGGSISGEHGDGLSRTQFLEMQFGPELYRVFHEVKDVWDPHHILNPGKIVYNTDPHLVRSNLRHGPGYRHDGMARRELVWKPGELEREAERCNGCAECRAVETIVTMCPIFKATGDEAASPRAKGNLMRLLMNGRLDPEWAATDEFKRVADLCVNCKACFLECPSHVNIPVMMMEAKAQWVAENGQTIPNLFFVHAELVSKLNSMVAPLANWAARNPILRWAMEKMIGVDRRRTLPEFSSRTFLRNSDEHYRARAAQRPQGGVLRGPVRELQRPAARRGVREGDEPQRRGGGGAARPGGVRHARDGLRQRRAGQAHHPPQRARAETVDRKGLHRGDQRADRHPEPQGRVPLLRGRRRRRERLPRRRATRWTTFARWSARGR